MLAGAAELNLAEPDNPHILQINKNYKFIAKIFFRYFPPPLFIKILFSNNKKRFHVSFDILEISYAYFCKSEFRELKGTVKETWKGVKAET